MSVLIDTGNLGADPELRYTKDGKPVLNLRICVTHYQKNQTTGEYTPRGLPKWYNAAIFDQRAEDLSKVLKKGYKVEFYALYAYDKEWENNGRKGVRTELFKPQILEYWPPKNQGNPPTGNGQGQWGTPDNNPWAQPAQDQQPTQNAPAQQTASADPWVISNNDNNPPF
ncbi:single-stranded DNA-binding protein [Varibaculum cambriense]|uniref:single-stranded DNA-binding protein n=1 Tax=Varibaculum cambriense TaxID=184870 RepID=UPI00241E5B1E|nr:single-stranded DNA-binding protein [Varibaculum cambriense]MBS5944903.1 single-stranded DNA-binding protein [Varibaculum cambriense]